MQKRFESLDAFRGICALLVLMYHLNMTTSIAGLAFFRNSSVFVIFFFILSGFVLAHSYGYREGVTFKRFFKSRFLRIYPLHFFMFLVFLGLEFFKYARPHIVGIDYGIKPFVDLYAPSEILPNLLLLQAWLPNANPPSYNPVAWSISVEFYMYMIFICTVLFANKCKEFLWLGLCIVFYYLKITEHPFVEDAQYGMISFFAGTMVYVIRKKTQHIQVSDKVLSYLEIIMICVTVGTVSASFSNKYVILPIIFSFNVFVFSYDRGILSKFLQVRPLQYLGELSYSIYMTHFVITILMIDFFMILFQKGVILEVNFKNVYQNNAYGILCIVLTLLVSHFTYKYIELKFKMPSVTQAKPEA